MYKNQLQELAQRSCFSLPAYTSIREGPDHAPRFKAAVNFNGEVFESPAFCTTLRQAEHSAAEAALLALSTRGPSYSLAARILDETGVYKNLLQEVAQRVGASLPSYTTVRSGLGHLPVFTCTVELAGISFSGEPAKNKKQAEKNAASAAWASLKQLTQQVASSSNEPENTDEQEQIRIARALLNYRLKEKMAMASNPHSSPLLPSFPKNFPIQPSEINTNYKRAPSSSPHLQPSHHPNNYSKILPLIRPKSNARSRPDTLTTPTDGSPRPKFPAAGAPPYVPVRHYRIPCHSMAPPVTIRTAVPVFSAPPLPPPPAAVHNHQLPPIMGAPPPMSMASPVRVRLAVPAFASLPQTPNPVIPVQVKEVAPVRPPAVKEVVNNESSVQVKEDQVKKDLPAVSEKPASEVPGRHEDLEQKKTVSEEVGEKKMDEVAVVESLKQLEI